MKLLSIIIIVEVFGILLPKRFVNVVINSGSLLDVKVISKPSPNSKEIWLAGQNMFSRVQNIADEK